MPSSDTEGEATPASTRRSNGARRSTQNEARSSQIKKQSTSDESEQEHAEEEEEQKPAKRRKVDDSDQEDDDEQEEEEDATDVKRKNVRDPKDGYEKGAITRIACKNFMTYDYVECTPGPHLNMVIGPNGTGKSTIVSAIALGLGYSPKELGRAKNIREFVKNGSTGESWLEIEIKNDPGKKNIVIKRFLNGTDNASTFELNGKTTPFKTVKATVESMNVQVDNLCCFLSQERVAEFAKLNPSTLLKETQRTAGHVKLTEWHETLIVEKQRLLGLEVALKDEKNNLKREEDANKGNERDVRRYEERQGVEKEIKILKVQIPFSRYSEIRDEVTTEKDALKELKTTLREKEAENAPYVVARQRLKADIRKAEEMKGKLRNKFTTLEGDENKKKALLVKAHTSSESVRQQLEDVGSEEKQRINKIKHLESKVADLEQKTSDANKPNVDLAPINAELSRIMAEIRDIHNKVLELQAQQMRISDNKRPIEQEIDQLKNRLRELDQVHKQKDEKLRREQRLFARQGNGAPVNGTWEAIQWLRANQNRLQDVVYEPIRLIANSTNSASAKYLEACISLDRSKTFVCRSAADYDLLADEFNQRRGWRVNLATLGNLGPLESFRPPVPTEQIRALGFDGYALDLLEAPDDIKRYLCDQSNLHRIPISTSNYEIDASSFETPNSGIARYISNGLFHTFGFSRYGNRDYYSQSSPINDSHWCGLSVDMEAKNAIGRQIADKQSALSQIDADLQPLRVAETEIRNQHQPLKEEKDGITAQKKEMERVIKTYETAKTTLQADRVLLERARRAPSSEKKKADLTMKLRKLAMSRLTLAKDVIQLVEKQAEVQSEITYNILQLLEAQAKYQSLESGVAERNTELVEMKEAYAEREAEYKATVNKAKAILAAAQEKLNNSDTDTQAEYERRRAEDGMRPAEELEALLQEQQLVLEGTANVGQAVIRQYEERLKKIAASKAKIEAAEKQEAKMSRAIAKVEGHYLPAINSLVDQVNVAFGEAFEAMGCSGEVEIKKDEDYAKWGLQILVSFRDGEPLQILTGQRQSGGERALSTILYFMSLTKLSTAPFSLVDEINQGMDPRAERAVMDLLVKTVCEEGASQYFIITPKLLQGLTYAKRMKVLCVNNGEWLPDAFVMKDWIEKAKQRRRGGALQPRSANV